MDVVDWLIEKVEDAGEALCDTVEDCGRKIGRKGDALFGCDEYENADVADRLAGFVGCHNDGTFKKKIQKESGSVEFGDIVGVSRGIYDHYGVYVNDTEVISYTSHSSDIGDNKIQKTTFARFLRNADSFFVLIFPEQHGVPAKANFSSPSIIQSPDVGLLSLLALLKSCNYQLSSPAETVRRANSKLGENRYNIVFNNCEHFAIWCKTGVKESHQVNRILQALEKVSYR